MELIDKKIHIPNKNIDKVFSSVPIQLLQCYFQYLIQNFMLERLSSLSPSCACSGGHAHEGQHGHLQIEVVSALWRGKV